MMAVIHVFWLTFVFQTVLNVQIYVIFSLFRNLIFSHKFVS